MQKIIYQIVFMDKIPESAACNEAVNLAKKYNLDAVTDIYPRYTSDALALWRAGYDTRAALIGPGVQASHGMERTHIKGLMNTLELCAAYLELI